MIEIFKLYVCLILINWQFSVASNDKTPSDSSSSDDDSDSSIYKPTPEDCLEYRYSFSGDNSSQADVVTLNDNNATSVNDKVIIFLVVV